MHTLQDLENEIKQLESRRITVQDAKLKGQLSSKIEELQVIWDSLRADEIRHDLIKGSLERPFAQDIRVHDERMAKLYTQYNELTHSTPRFKTVAQLQQHISKADQPQKIVRYSENWQGYAQQLAALGYTEEQIANEIRKQGGRVYTDVVLADNTDPLVKEVQQARQAMTQGIAKNNEISAKKLFSKERQQKQQEANLVAAKDVLENQKKAGELSDREYRKRSRELAAQSTELENAKKLEELLTKQVEIQKKIADIDRQMQDIPPESTDESRAKFRALQEERDSLIYERDRLVNSSTNSAYASDKIRANLRREARAQRRKENLKRVGIDTDAMFSSFRSAYKVSTARREARAEQREHRRNVRAIEAKRRNLAEEYNASAEHSEEERLAYETRQAQLAKQQEKEERAAQEARKAKRANSILQELKSFTSSAKKVNKNTSQTLINLLFLLMLFYPQLQRAWKWVKEKVSDLWNAGPGKYLGHSETQTQLDRDKKKSTGTEVATGKSRATYDSYKALGFSDEDAQKLVSSDLSEQQHRMIHDVLSDPEGKALRDDAMATRLTLQKVGSLIGEEGVQRYIDSQQRMHQKANADDATESTYGNFATSGTGQFFTTVGVGAGAGALVGGAIVPGAGHLAGAAVGALGAAGANVYHAFRQRKNVNDYNKAFENLNKARKEMLQGARNYQDYYDFMLPNLDLYGIKNIEDIDLSTEIVNGEAKQFVYLTKDRVTTPNKESEGIYDVSAQQAKMPREQFDALFNSPNPDNPDILMPDAMRGKAKKVVEGLDYQPIVYQTSIVTETQNSINTTGNVKTFQ